MRYLPLDAADRAQMLTRVGAPDIDALFADIPAAKRLAAPLDLPSGLGEIEVERRLDAHGRRATSRRGRFRSSSAPAPIATTSRRPSTT